MKYTDTQRLEHMVSTTRKLLNYLSENNITPEDVLAHETLRWTITTPLYNIGEHAYYLSDTFKSDHPDIPWSKISGLRHRLVHDYESTNWSLICSVLFDVLPGFAKDLELLLESSTAEPSD